ncbi:phosphoribosylamine--glycine ligase [Candidatus Palibaumannia cicadellinicola]|uniref:Phosphoribosylamine--glycine ligase n=1 Tax=Baumannia cicadellinicola subsp. Homalodisca coagulata TaxID=374463 RepID=Q1LU50_BAUCH|nr:phosphoribosylamine--glycine ligase [Candidatus Baumannia cicadellinicola]ABF14073.1 phosphoribosylamine--glycine ligase [Baumannia cicadellinicola str. Hc (Homalodisca coagulata)]MCJ7462512.1 phosphoribosylamine--glycine ligase [Candidatus Baumannia cicadellinicola]MCJ7462572.1 phosphoribosylamine--glycine ligase [Candidatus Baumannia cicadellinicola]
MNILIIGNGGREHALAWKVANSNLVNKVFVAPGNAGTDLEASLENIDLSTEIPKLVEFAKQHDIGLTIVGPETLLVEGIVDIFQTAGLRIFGPTKAAAQLEGSKIFAKNFLTRHRIPTGFYQHFTEISPAIAYVKQQGTPLVIKANGLAAGKGVIVAFTQAEAESAIKYMLTKHSFGKANNSILIEEYLRGEEVSFMVMVDGNNILPMATSQDYKRVGENNTGPNTGGMGAYSPVPAITDQLYQIILNQVIYPTIQGMASEDNLYTGFLYAGLIITPDGQPKVLEFNCRLGDPETQTIMLRMRSDLVAHCLAAIKGKLNQEKAIWTKKSALSIVLASGGYPHHYRIGDEIYGLHNIQNNQEQKIFHAGTSLTKGKIITQSGRVLCVTALGSTLEEAKVNAYRIADLISWPDSFYRRDIGTRFKT